MLQLVDTAKEIALAAGYSHTAVISAIGTREYYVRHGFEVNGLYIHLELIRCYQLKK